MLDWLTNNPLLAFFIGIVTLVLVYDLKNQFTNDDIDKKKQRQSKGDKTDFSKIRGEEHSKMTKKKDSFSQYNQWGG